MTGQAAVVLEELRSEDPTLVADRYTVQNVLGRGGMATAYRATDAATGTMIALKVLRPEIPGAKTRAVELFEREYHTLVQLAHPRIVKALDYGVDGDRPYYTMELLDGGDLHGLTPMPWRQLTEAAYEICSALALLHSRQLVHRDLTPRNIRRTGDGKAKLIDFGLLSPMGPATVIAGTPPFVAPELVNGVSLDGRSDLFSLGATLYFVLTGHLAFSARRFDRLRDAWRSNPIPPSRLVNDIPPALDALLLALLRVDTGSRPKTAAEVMDRLLPLLDRAPDDELRVARAHLTAPRLVGREEAVVRFRQRISAAARGEGGGFVIGGEAGLGRTRMIDAFVLEAKLAGATTARASAAHATAPFGVAAALLAQFHDAAPTDSLRAAGVDAGTRGLLFTAHLEGVPASGEVLPFEPVDITRPGTDRVALQSALRSFFLRLTSHRSIAIAIDDVDEIDEPSAALLASLTWEAPRHRLAYAASLDLDPDSRASAAALDVLRERSEDVTLPPLRAEETTELLESVFGDTANLHLLSARLHALCGGVPRDCMLLAQELVDRGAITYAGGSFTLPGELTDELLPKSVEETLARTVASLGPAARRLAAYLSLAVTGRLSRAELVELTGETTLAVDAALDELLGLRLVTGDTSGYAWRDGSLARLLRSTLGAEEEAGLHLKLAEKYEGWHFAPLVVAYHKLYGNAEEGLDYLWAHAQDSESRTRLVAPETTAIAADAASRLLARAVDEAHRLGRPKKELMALWVMLAGLTAQGVDADYYYQIKTDWLEQTKHDTGWNDWQLLDPSFDPGARAMMALGAAVQRFGSAPEHEQGFSPPDAIKQMVAYVVFSIAVAVRASDLDLMASLPELLEPFAPLNPMVAAMLSNARGTLQNGEGKREAARATFLHLLSQLDAITGAELAYVHRIRGALLQTLAEIDASLGIKSEFIDRLQTDRLDDNQAMGARYLLKVAALHQGNWEAAENYREQAELWSLQNQAVPMFSTLGQELEAHAMARDLTGLKQVRARIHEMAARHPGWAPVMLVADSAYLRLCGDLDASLDRARAAREAGMAGRIRSPWIVQAATAEAEVLVELGRPAEALAIVSATLPECERDGMRYLARGLSQAAALAEGKLGRFDEANTRVHAVIAEQMALGVTGLQLGRSYELGARIAIWSGNFAAFKDLSDLAADQYRPGESSVLGALYERLMEEARQRGVGSEVVVEPLPEPSTLDAMTHIKTMTVLGEI